MYPIQIDPEMIRRDYAERLQHAEAERFAQALVAAQRKPAGQRKSGWRVMRTALAILGIR